MKNQYVSHVFVYKMLQVVHNRKNNKKYYTTTASNDNVVNPFQAKLHNAETDNIGLTIVEEEANSGGVLMVNKEVWKRRLVYIVFL